MGFQVEKQGEVTVVDVEGQLIVGNRQELKQKVLDELEKGERRFLIDFTRTGYIDSSGLGVLVSLSKKIREQGGELRLANLNDDLKTLPQGLTTFMGEYTTDWGVLFSGLTLSAAPIIIIYILLSKQFIAGMTSGAVK